MITKQCNINPGWCNALIEVFRNRISKYAANINTVSVNITPTRKRQRVKNDTVFLLLFFYFLCAKIQQRMYARTAIIVHLSLERIIFWKFIVVLIRFARITHIFFFIFFINVHYNVHINYSFETRVRVHYVGKLLTLIALETAKQF
jgi:hypothetical protein